MVEMLSNYLPTRERWAELAALMDLAWPSVNPDSLLAARILFARARVLAASDSAEGIEVGEQALALARRYGEDSEVGLYLLFLGYAHFGRRNFEGALRIWREALAILELHGGTEMLGACLSNLATATPDYAQQEPLLIDAAAACRRSGNASTLVTVLMNLAILVSETYGDYSRAIELAREALTLERDEIGRPNELASIHGWIGYHLVQIGDIAGAELQLAEVARLLGELEPQDESLVPRLIEEQRALLVHLHYARGEVDLARAEAAKSVDNRDSCELLAWLALYECRAVDAERYRLRLVEINAGGQVSARTVLETRTLSHLLSAGVASLSTAAPHASRADSGSVVSADAVSELVAALQIITDFTYIPLALDAFLTAYTVAPATVGKEILWVAATHPAAHYRTRRRSLQLLGLDASGGAAQVSGGLADRPLQGMATSLPPDAVLKLARELADGLVAARELPYLTATVSE